MTQLRFSARSLADLAEIWDRISPGSPRNAAAVHERLYEKCAQLITQPRIGHPRNDVSPGLRCLNSDGYVIFYRLGKSAVRISRIIHHSRRISDLDFTESS